MLGFFFTRFTQVVSYSIKGIFLFAVHGAVQAVSVAGEIFPFLRSLTEYSRVFYEQMLLKIGLVPFKSYENVCLCRAFNIVKSFQVHQKCYILAIYCCSQVKPLAFTLFLSTLFMMSYHSSLQTTDDAEQFPHLLFYYIDHELDSIICVVLNMCVLYKLVKFMFLKDIMRT